MPAKDLSLVSIAKANRAGDQSVKHGVEVEGRTVDDIEHLGGSGLSSNASVTFGDAFSEFEPKFCDCFLGIGCRIVRCLSRIYLLIFY